jgi:adenosylhomocysteine nucleosidase
MELFAIASVAHEHKIDWLSYKFISDDANESSSQEWSTQVNQGQKLFVEKLHAYLVSHKL